MTSITNTSLETRLSVYSGHTLVGRSATWLLGAAMLLTLVETASAQEQAEGPVDGDESSETAATLEDSPGPEGDADAAPKPAAAAAASTSEEPAASEKASSPVESVETTEAESSCDPPTFDETPISDKSMAPASLSPVQSRALRPLSWKKSPGQGFSFGMEEGLWGNAWSQGLRVTIPFTRYLGTTLRGVYLIEMAEGPFTADAGGRLDLFGRSDAFFNVVRLYGGGGVQVLAPVANTDGRKFKVGVGGHFGFEFFHSPAFSYFLEVGGQGGEPSPGATVVAGMMFYPWTR